MMCYVVLEGVEVVTVAGIRNIVENVMGAMI